MTQISESTILATFDDLVSKGSIIYGPYETVNGDVDGYPMAFRICPSLTKKPHAVGAKLDPSFDKSEKWGPGSDMYLTDQRLRVAVLNGTHDLALNLFAIDRPQFVLLTLDSYRRQHEPLDVDDFKAALEMVNELKDIYAIFNCSEAAGCSRVHKHMQGLRGPPTAFDSFTKGSSKIPFKSFAHHFTSGFSSVPASDILGVYQQFLEKTRKLLGKNEQEVCPHNVVLWRDWMIVVPRRQAAVEKASANAAGMLGSVWVPERSGVDVWLRLGCKSVLEQLGAPATKE
ncbi:hypothetical protein K504DRAFT_368043 [Pleomassaria siparia CBS 279.74]|uniref:Uncharacterized protein n=1 Tax=Pleomassaria siparia CBS 279.74 TaxID=1314801 RepID=A0A6G1KQW5_9PLEO|nr:hypothetical protein K504DRAFT_368043 [Pleomassaria siparia CBS 279.74]